MDKEFLRFLNIHMKEILGRVKNMEKAKSLGLLAIITKDSFLTIKLREKANFTNKKGWFIRENFFKVNPMDKAGH